jgi:hypothetical protein
MTSADVIRWALVVALVLVLIGLIAYARGPKHHHGDDVGAHPSAAGLVHELRLADG